MAVNALATRPKPPNNNLVRSMWVWITAQASQDPLDTDSDQQALLNFCGANGIMEAQHALIANAFVSNTNSVFMGQSVHNYDGYRVMP